MSVPLQLQLKAITTQLKQERFKHNSINHIIDEKMRSFRKVEEGSNVLPNQNIAMLRFESRSD